MRNESQNQLLTLHNNVLMWGERHPKLYLEMQKNAGTKAEKEGGKKRTKWLSHFL